jgi:hypothetical protein
MIRDSGRATPLLRVSGSVASFRCAIHPRLRQLGFPGCTVYDCFGAGQHVSQVTFGGQDWRRVPHTAQRMFDVFAIMRPLHELCSGTCARRWRWRRHVRSTPRSATRATRPSG